MFTVLNCIFIEHDLRLVVLAALLCFGSCGVAMMLMHRASVSRKIGRWIWLASAGMAAGFGIWGTHFVAMLAYDPGVVFGYEIDGTLLSLLISVATTCLAVTVASVLPGRTGWAGAGFLFGAGVSSMHFIGMSAIEFPGTLLWDRRFVAAAIVLAIALSVPAFHLSSKSRDTRPRVLPSALVLMLGIVVMHFTAMAAIDVRPGPVTLNPTSLLSPALMVAAIATVSLSLLFVGIAAALFAIWAESAAARSENNFRLLVQGVTDYAIYMLDLEGRVANWNAGAERAKGYRAEEIVGQDFGQFYSDEDRTLGLPGKALETARSKGKFEAEGWRYRKDGSRFWASVVIDPIFDETGRQIGYAKITKDRSEQRAAAEALAVTSRNLQHALEHMANGLCLYDASETLVLHNPRVREIFDVDPDLELVGKTFRELCTVRCGSDPQAAEELYRMHRDLFTKPGGGEHVRTIENGRTIRTIHSPAGGGAFVMTVEDISERVRTQEQISHLARHDTLTGLPNRREFVERLEAAMELAERRDTKVAVICIDLDNFKEINDTFGHGIGDKVLCEISSRIVKDCGADEYVARLGGDEFVAFKSYTDQAELDGFLARVHASLTEKIALDHGDLVPGASIGVAIYPNDAGDRGKLLSNADMAMYRSKESIGEKISYYEASMDEAARERRAMARDVWTALETGQFHLAYQVQRAVRTDEVTGYEVLLRWKHPVHGMIPPSTFIPVAEECGAISALGDWVLEEACREAATWPIEHKIAVNLSPLQLGNVAFVEKVHTTLMKTGLPASRLELEVTESAIIGDKARALHILRQIKAMGVAIAIDDFGTGYSSLETLRSFPFDKIKLDRSFVSDLDTRQSKAFVRAIVALGKSLGVSILAEGVETRDQLEVLMSEGCDEVQGFLFGRPGTREQVLASAAAPLADQASDMATSRNRVPSRMRRSSNRST